MSFVSKWWLLKGIYGFGKFRLGENSINFFAPKTLKYLILNIPGISDDIKRGNFNASLLGIGQWKIL